MAKTTWTNMEIKERLMKEAQALVNGMNSVIESTDKRKDWESYFLCYEKASQTLYCLYLLTNRVYTIESNADGKEEIHEFVFK